MVDWSSSARKDYLDAILRLSPAERQKDRGASFGSIQEIFVHVLDDYLWWFEYVPQDRQDEYEAIKGSEIGETELRRLNRRVDRVVHAVLDPLTIADLSRRYVVRGISGDGKPYTLTCSLSAIIWHMVEEELQHRGELNALFWQMDIDPPTRGFPNR